MESHLKKLFKQEEKDDNNLNVLLAVLGDFGDKQAPKQHLEHLILNVHVAQEIRTQSFKTKCHVLLASFCKLCG